MPTIYTAQYRYSGPDRLDITVKGQGPIGRIFAPTWDMVSGVKNGTLLKYESEAAAVEKATGKRPPSYEGMYHKLMEESWKKHNHIWQNVWNMPETTLVCFCPDGSFCHRYLLKDMFVSVGAVYGGERSL